MAHGPSCSAACGIFPDQGSNPRPLPWQADSQPLPHQGSPSEPFSMKDSILGQILLPLIAKLNEWVRKIRLVREQQTVALLLFTDVLLSTNVFRDRK